jgi:Zn-dependent M28 family amino/carboxypeptidase
MRLITIALGALLLPVAAAHAQATSPPPAVVPANVQGVLERLRARALASNNAYEIVESLTTEVGPRLAGSPGEARARDWAVAMLRAQGFENVRVETFDIPYWRATRQTAEITAPAPQPLAIAALGGSASTPAGGTEAEVIRFASVSELEAAPAASIAGRIVFVDERMTATADGAGYGAAVRKRGACPRVARERRAAACLIRSVGTDSHRFPHQGASGAIAQGAGVPAAALSNPDADQLARLLSRGRVRLRLQIETETQNRVQSGNVIGEIRGRDRPDEIVLLGAHLDSWDAGTGAIDDGAGVAIVAAAARLIRDLPRRPRRTIRLVLFGAEETGVFGGADYARRHANELPKHVVASESDFGAGRIWRYRTRFGAGDEGYAARFFAALAPLEVFVTDAQPASGGADIGAMREAGVPVFDLTQNGLDYFDYHHTADDTLDKIDPAALRQNVAAWATIAYLAAETDWNLRSAEAR